MKREQLLKLLAGTGVDLSKPRPFFEHEEVVWTMMLIIHCAVLLGLIDLAMRLLWT